MKFVFEVNKRDEPKVLYDLMENDSYTNIISTEIMTIPRTKIPNN